MGISLLRRTCWMCGAKGISRQFVHPLEWPAILVCKNSRACLLRWQEKNPDAAGRRP